MQTHRPPLPLPAHHDTTLRATDAIDLGAVLRLHWTFRALLPPPPHDEACRLDLARCRCCRRGSRAAAGRAFWVPRRDHQLHTPYLRSQWNILSHHCRCWHLCVPNAFLAGVLRSQLFAAGLALAARLSAVSSNTVLVLEAGAIGAANPQVFIPGEAGAALGSGIDWGFSTTPQASAKGRSIYTPRGKVCSATTIIIRD